ncbi:mitochondria-eating protein [Artibeus jamaicensis]|uniref:mitochondria-eating protein n=1 Tax=Artibeus jamaicensis TaxID=9417 RepID=UPI00187C815D|nr:mitochondria-eating protein [Artibeus jamaicensis]
MAENLRKLISSESLRLMHDSLERWLREYNTNSCDQNLSLCLEFIEQVARVQGQLFGILTITAQEGGHYDGVQVIKSRLLPWLEASFTAASMGKPVDSKVPSLQDTFDKERQKESSARDRDSQQLDSELRATRSQLNQVQDDLAESAKTLEATKNRSAISLLAAEEEINQLRKQLKSLQAQEESRHRNAANRTSARRTGELRAEPRASELRRTKDRSSDKRGSDRSDRRVSERSDRRVSDRSDRRVSDRSDQRGSDSLDKRGSDRSDSEVISDYEKQLRTLKDEIAVLSAEKSVLQGRSTRSRSPSPAPRSRSPSRSRSHSRGRSHSRSHSRSRSRSHSHSRPGSPSNAVVKVRTPSPNRAKLSSAARKAALVSRFSDAYSQARLDAQCLLRQCIDKAETVQRIIYIATVEAFHVAKMAFRHFKIRVRKSLTPSYAGSNEFDDAVSEYIICHLDLYDSQSSVNDVIRAMNVNPKISFPPEVDFCLLSNFIQEICCIAFAMQTLEPPLDIAFGADGEVFNDSKYRRSYDSDFSAPLVFYHVWPALMENDIVIMKGEAVTRRGAFWNSVRPVSRCRSRSLSPIYPRSHIGLSTLPRSRSPSPIRCGLPRF